MGKVNKLTCTFRLQPLRPGFPWYLIPLCVI
jgi:hypothetical protein